MSNTLNNNNNSQQKFFGTPPSGAVLPNYQQRPPYIKREQNLTHSVVNHFLDRETVHLYSQKPFFLFDSQHGYFTPASTTNAPPFAWLSVQGRVNGVHLAALWKHRDVLVDYLEQQNLEQNLPRHPNQQKGTANNASSSADTQKSAVINILKELDIVIPEQKKGTAVNETLKTGLIATLESLGFEIPEDKKVQSTTVLKKSSPKTEVEKLQAELDALRNPSEESEVERLKKELEKEKAKKLRKEIAELKKQ